MGPHASPLHARALAPAASQVRWALHTRSRPRPGPSRAQESVRPRLLQTHLGRFASLSLSRALVSALGSRLCGTGTGELLTSMSSSSSPRQEKMRPGPTQRFFRFALHSASPSPLVVTSASQGRGPRLGDAVRFGREPGWQAPRPGCHEGRRPCGMPGHPDTDGTATASAHLSQHGLIAHRRTATTCAVDVETSWTHSDTGSHAAESMASG